MTASYDDTTGKISYHSSEQFTAMYQVAAGTGTDDDGFFDGSDGATGATFSAVVAPVGGSNQLTVSGFDFRLGHCWSSSRRPDLGARHLDRQWRRAGV